MLGAANVFAGVNITFKGTSATEADPNPTPLSLSGQIPETATSADSLLWKGNGNNERTDAYVSMDKSYEFTQLFISGGGGAWSDLNMQFENGTTLTLTSNSGFGFNSGQKEGPYGIDMNFYAAENAKADIVLTNGYKVSLVVQAEEYYNPDAQYKRNISFGQGLTVTNNKALEVTGAEDSAFTINSVWNNATTTTFIDGTVNVGGTYTSTGLTTLNNVALNVSGTYNATANTTFTNGAVLNVSGVYNENANANITLTEGTINIEKGGTYKTAGNLDLQGGSTMVINGTLDVGGNLLFNKDSNPSVTIGDGATIKAQSFRTRNLPLILGNGTQMILNQTTDTVGSTFINAGASEVQEGATLSITTTRGNYAITNHSSLKINGKLVVSGGNIATAAGGIEFNSSDITFTNVNLQMGNEGDLQQAVIRVNADNNFSDSVLMLGKYTSTTSAHNLYLGKDTDLSLKSLSFSNNTGFSENKITLKISLGENATLALTNFIEEIEGFGGTMAADDKIVINGFREKAISIINHTAADDTLLSQVEVSGVDQLYWNYDASKNVYWLSAIAIPEPAEWAAIFGAIALAFAAYRRRK